MEPLATMRRLVFWLALALFALAFGAGVAREVARTGLPPRPTPNLAAYVDGLLAARDRAGAERQLWLHLLLEPSEPVAQRLAQVATENGDRARQLDALRAWTTIRPESAPARAALAANLAVYEGATRPELAEAVRQARRAMALDGHLALAHAALGLAQVRLGQRGPGEASLREALRLDPELTVARAGLAALGTR
jgi:hypothetical protein